MKFLSRQCCLSLALLASMSLVGCGGGGGHSDPAPVSGPSASVAAEAVVSPIVKNADAILSGVPTNASVRFSVDEDENYFNVSEANSIIKNLFDVDSFVRMATSLDGMVRDDTILFGGNVSYETYDRYIYGWVASLSGDVYERTKFEYDNESQKLIPVSVYKITGVSGSVKDNRLTSLNIKKGAKFEVKIENYNYNASNSWVKNRTSSITGTFNTAFGCKEEVVSSTDLNKEGRIFNNGEDVTDSKTETWGYKPVKEETRRITYTFGEGLGLTVENYSYEDIENGYKPVTGKLNVDFSGITGIVTKEGKVYSEYIMYRDCDYEPFAIKSDWYTDGYLNQYLSGDIITKENLTVKEPVNIAFTNIKAAAGESNANIKNIQVIAKKVTKAAKIADSLFADVEAHIDVEATYKEQPIKIASYTMGFTTAKIDVTGLKCQTEMKDTEMLANAIAKLEAKEENSKISISAKYDYAKKTATAKLINNGDTTVTDGIMVFNFKTADITATNADALLKPRFEGALLDVTAIEKDGAISQRSYKVVDGKLVLQNKNDRIKVEVPKGLPQSGSDIAKAAEDAKTPATAKDDTTAIFKVGKKTDGSTVATFDKPSSGDNKEVKINVAAKDKVIISVGFYGSEFTIVFAFDTANHIIKGSVFKGKVENAKLEGQNPVATFASTDGKTVTLFGDDSSSTTFPVK